MKVWNTLLSLIIILLFSIGSAFGATLEKDTISLLDVSTGKTATYPITTTLLNGKELETDVPGYIVQNGNIQTVYVPVSTIYRSMNATVTWNSKVKRLTIKQGMNTYLFDIGKSSVTVNGNVVPIEGGNKVMLMKYAGVDRTMVPASVIASQMGMEYKYQPEIRTANISQPMAKIQGMTYNPSGKYKEIRVKTSSEISIKSYNIDGSAYGGKSMVIVEFQNAVLDSGVATSLPVTDAGINRIDLINPGKTPPRIRLEVELNSPQGFSTYYDKTTKEQVVLIVNTLKDIQAERSGDYHVINIKTGIKPTIAVKKLQGKLVIDFLDTKLSFNNGSAGEKLIQSYGLTNVAFSQFDPKFEYQEGDLVSRVVLNFMDRNQQDKAFVKETPEGVKIFIEGDPDRGVRYDKVSSAASKLEFAFAQDTTVTKTLNPETQELVIEIPRTAIFLENVFRDYQDNIVQYLDVNANVEMNPTNYVVRIKLMPGTVVYDNSTPSVLSVSFINEQIKSSENRKTLIVLDAGHGGSDPGTIGKYTGAKEKDLALKAVYELKTELEKEGFEVALTRTNDTRVELLQRTDFANEINADLFLSIHYNAVDKSDVNGIEVLYYPEHTGEKYRLATALFKELVSSTGAKARGVVKRPLLVVPRETKMPSAMIEMGFLSNRDEEIRLQNPDYLNVQLKAIVEAVKLYLGTK